MHAFSLFLSLSHSTSVHGIPQNITRSRHSFFTVDRRREPRDNNGGEERFATAITLRRRERRAFLFSPFPLHSIPFARSLARLEGGRRVGRSGQSLVTFRSRGTDRPRLFLSPVHLASSFTLCVCVCSTFRFSFSLTSFLLPPVFCLAPCAVYRPLAHSCSPSRYGSGALPRASLYTGHPSFSLRVPPPLAPTLRDSDSKTPKRYKSPPLVGLRWLWLRDVLAYSPREEKRRRRHVCLLSSRC